MALRPGPRAAPAAPDWPDLWLLRHGQTVWNAEGRLQGRLDSPLTATGVAQAQRQGRLVATILAGGATAAPALWSSPQGRAVRTARIVFDGRPFGCDPRLAEIDLGAFTGARTPDLRAAHPQLFPAPRPGEEPLGWYDLCPGGEGFGGLERRVRAFLTGLTGPAVIVTHGITLRMIVLVASGLPPEAIGRIPVLQGAVHHIGAGRHRVIC